MILLKTDSAVLNEQSLVKAIAVTEGPVIYRNNGISYNSDLSVKVNIFQRGKLKEIQKYDKGRLKGKVVFLF